MSLRGTKTEQNLKAALTIETLAYRRYQYFAVRADVEGYPEVAQLFRSISDGEAAHANGHLKFLEAVCDPVTGEPIGTTELNLKAAVAGETEEYTARYPEMAQAARAEGFAEVAEWFDTLAKAERAHAGRFQTVLEDIKSGSLK